MGSFRLVNGSRRSFGLAFSLSVGSFGGCPSTPARLGGLARAGERALNEVNCVPHVLTRGNISMYAVIDPLRETELIISQLGRNRRTCILPTDQKGGSLSHGVCSHEPKGCTFRRN